MAMETARSITSMGTGPILSHGALRRISGWCTASAWTGRVAYGLRTGKIAESSSLTQKGTFWPSQRGIGTVFTDDKYLYAAELDGGVTLIDLDTLEVAAQLGAPGDAVLKVHGICVDDGGNIYLATNKANENNLIRLARME